MSKPLLVYQAPVATRSGYGDHSRDILKSIFEYDKFDVITIGIAFVVFVLYFLLLYKSIYYLR